MSKTEATNVKESNQEKPVRRSSEKLQKTSDFDTYILSMSEYQGFLTLILIIVTAYFGWKNLTEQKKNNELQQSIYAPRFVPTEYIPAQDIDGEYQSTFKVSNHGYVGGNYKVTVKSGTFYLTRRDRINERSVSWSYHVPQNDESVQEFTIIAPNKSIPLHASYHIELRADGYGPREYHFCYQNTGDRNYKRVSCK